MNKETCVYCLDVIDNDLCILSCGCKSYLYHNKCINNYLQFKNQCPTCKKQWAQKPVFKSNYVKKNQPIENVSWTPPISRPYVHHPTQTGPTIFALNYNILRILSGNSGLQYTN
jgi:hypothetical protein